MAYSIDTRSLQPGDIFIPVKGPNFDGHDFIAAAYQKGASAVLDVDLGEFASQHRAKFKIPIIAVTGSAGKTTVKDMLAQVLSKKFSVLKSAENQNNEIGVPLTLLKLEPHHEIAIIEMAMRGLGQISYLANLTKPTHALITNVGYTHLELLQTRDSIALAKSEIIGKRTKVFLNQRDDYYDFLRSRAEENDALIYPFTYASVSEANLAAVSAVACQFGFTPAEIQASLNNLELSGQRQKIIKSKSLPEVTIIDDSYNSNPDAVRFAIEVLKEKAGRQRKIAILGDMKELGSQESKLHQEVPLRGVNIVISFGSLAQNFSHKFSFQENEKAQLIQKVKELAKPGDWILVKGSRSMKMEEIVQAII